MKSTIAEKDWLDNFRDCMMEANSFRACITLGASWLCEWIDGQLPSEGRRTTSVSDYVEFCFARAEEMESWLGEEEELWVWAWSAAAELLDFYELAAQWNDSELLAKICDDFEDPEISDKEGYTQHLIVSALAFIHGWEEASSR